MMTVFVQFVLLFFLFFKICLYDNSCLTVLPVLYTVGGGEADVGTTDSETQQCTSMGLTLSAMGDCTDRLTGTNAHELRATSSLLLKPHFKDFLRMIAAVRETFQDRAEALLKYEILSDKYDAVISEKVVRSPPPTRCV